jgi:hypothetical protein
MEEQKIQERKEKLEEEEAVLEGKLQVKDREINSAGLTIANNKRELLAVMGQHPKIGKDDWSRYKSSIEDGPTVKNGKIVDKIPSAGNWGSLFGRSDKGKQIEAAHNTLEQAINTHHVKNVLKKGLLQDLDLVRNKIGKIDNSEVKDALSRNAYNRQMAKKNDEMAKVEAKLKLQNEAKKLGFSSVSEYNIFVKAKEDKEQKEADANYAKDEYRRNNETGMTGLMGGKRNTKCRKRSKRSKRCKTTKRKKTNKKSKRRKRHQKKSTKRKTSRRH